MSTQNNHNDSSDAAAPRAPSMRGIWTRLLIYPTHTLPTAAAPVLVGMGLAWRDHVFAAWPAVLALIGSWFIHLAGIFIDNYELLRRHPSVPEHPELLGALQRGTLKLGTLRLAIAACIVAGVLAGLYLVVLGGALAIVLGAVGLAASAGYAGWPFRYARTGLAEPVFFVMFGVIAELGTYFIQYAAVRGSPPGFAASVSALPWYVFVVGLPVGALVTNVLIIDDIRDQAFDTTKGWRTGAVRFGIGSSRMRYVALSVLAYTGPILLWVAGGYRAWVLLPLLTLPLAWSIARRVLRYESTSDLLAATPRASTLSLVFAMLLGVGIAIA